jgi:hypothetical protein
MKKKQAENNTQQVDDYMSKLEHPFRAEMEAVRQIIMNANPGIAEHIKWGAPSFFFRGGIDKGGMATFNHRAQNHVHLVFHNGIILNDDTGLLEGDYKDRRMAYFYDMNDVNIKKSELERLVNKWVEPINKNSVNI